MALPFLNSTRKKPDHMLSIDLGARTTKAAFVQRKGTASVLVNYALLDAPIFEKDPSEDLLAEHFKQVAAAIETKAKFLSLALGVNESIARHIEMPKMPPDDMRMVLKNNSRLYLQQDLKDYVFDAVVTSPPAVDAAGKAQKSRVLVAGMRRELTLRIQSAAKRAGLIAENIMPGVIAPMNAFECAMPREFASDVFALVDIGFKHTTICLFGQGELIMSREVAIGGDKFSSGLSEAMNISYAEAESIKIGMPAEVQNHLEPMVIPLGRELRASIDFFEHQQDRALAGIYFTGGSSRSELIMQIMKQELMMDCRLWNPTSGLQHTLPAQKAAELEHIAPQLAAAVGAALTAL